MHARSHTKHLWSLQESKQPAEAVTGPAVGILALRLGGKADITQLQVSTPGQTWPDALLLCGHEACRKAWSQQKVAKGGQLT